MAALLYKDDHNKVAYLAKGKGWEAYEQILEFLNRSHIRYALTHRPPIVFDSLVKQFWATATVRTLEAGTSKIIATVNGNEVVVTESLIRTQLQLNDANGLYVFALHDVLDGMQEIGYPTDGSLTFYKAKLSPQWRFLIHTLIHLVPAGGDCADTAAAGTAAANDVPPPPDVPHTHPSFSTLGPSIAAQDTPVREPTPKEVGPTTSTRPPSLTRQTSFQENISEGGGADVSSPKSNEALPTTATTGGGGAEDSAVLTNLSLKLDRCINRVTTLENELDVTKKVLGGAILKLVSRVKRLEGLLQQRKRRLVLSDSEGEEAATNEQDINLDALHKLASTSLGGDTTVEAAYTIYKASQDAHAFSDAAHDEDEVPNDTPMPFRRIRTKRRWLRKTYTSLAFEHFQEHIFAVENTIPAGDSNPADAQTSPAGTADKGKAPMVDDSLPAYLLTNQERILKNLHDYQLGEELAKKLQAEQEAEFERQQEELAQKAQSESVASPAEQDWLKLMAKIASNSALSKQLLGDDVNEENINEWLGMLLMRKRRELAEQSLVKVLSIAQLKHEFEFIQQHLERSNLLNFNRSTFRPKPTLEALTAKRARQGVPQVPAASSQVPASVLAASSIAADVTVSAVSTTPAAVSPAPTLPAELSIPASGSVGVSTGITEATTTSIPVPPHATSSSLCSRRKQIAKKRVTHIVDVADDVLIKFDSASESDDDPLPYAPYAGWEMVPTPFGSIHAYYDMEEHTKHFTSLCEILHMVEKNDLQQLLGDSLADEDAHAFWRNQDSWCIRSWRLYPRAQVHVLETVDGWVIYMFVDVSYPLSASTLERMLKHGLEVPKLLVGGDLTMAEQLVSFIKAALLTAQYVVWSMWLVQRGTALELASPEQTATDRLLLFHDPAVFGVPAGCSSWFPHFCWFLVAAVWLFAVLFCSCCWNNDAILELTSEDLSRILKLMLSNSRLGEDCWELQN
nr:xylulose kinase-1 [Tanacetum cinerariifolium]